MIRVLVILVAGFAAFAQQNRLQDAVTALRENQFERALEILDPLIKDTPWNPQLWAMQGIAFASSGQPQRALLSFREAIKLKPDFLPALMGAAQIEFQLKEPNAQETLDKILSLQPQNDTAHAMAGMIAYDAQDCDAAVKHFQEAQGPLRSNPAGQWAYGHCLLVVKQPAKAAEVLQDLRKAMRQDEQLSYGLGVALFESEQYQQAIETLLPLARKEKPAPEVLTLLSDAYEASHRTPEALETLKRAVALYPYEELLYISVADLCMEHGSYELGLDVLSAGAANLPGSSRIRAMRGVIHAQLGQYGEAEAEFTEAASLDPDDISATIGHTLTLQETGRVDESIKLLREQVKENPADVAANFFLAQALVKKGVAPGEPEFTEAKNALETTVTADPRQVAARVELGKLLLKIDEIDEATRQFEEAVRLEPGDRTATYQLMRCYRRLGRSEEAASLMSKLRGQLEKGMEDDVKTNRYRLVRSGR